MKTVRFEFVCDDGPGALFHVFKLRMTEEVNGSYEIDIDLVTEDKGASTDAFLGASCQLDLARGDHQRTVCGIIKAVEYVGHTPDRLMVRVKAVPAFHLLTQQTHSRIFQDLSVQDILAQVLGEGLGPYGRGYSKGAVARGTAVRDYCVQYRETDHDFCVRLMEEEGISYHFAHDSGKEVLTLTYANSDFSTLQNVDGSSLVPVITDQANRTLEVESLQQFEFSQSLTTTAHMWRDYDFMTPLSLLEDNLSGSDAKGYSRRVYRHTDRRYIYDDVAARNADHREGTQGQLKIGRGTGNVTGFGVGKIFEVDRHDREDLETQFLITRVVHEAYCPEQLQRSEHGDTTEEIPRYRNSFECMPLDVPLRPARRTPRPRAYGPETGIVTGPPGEEIHVDEHGRIKVQFHWEEETTYDDTSSCWIRVRQPWAGPGWGFQFIPRVGQEVMVEFLGGNPDRPTVTGTFYNGDHRYPYTMPDDKTRSGIKTDSVGGDGSNELRFEDMAGAEEVYLHSQKNLTIATENDKNQTTGHDETLTVANDRTKQVDHDQKETVGNDKKITVVGFHSESIGKDMDLSVAGDRSTVIGGSDEESIGGSLTQGVADSVSQSVGSSKNVSVGTTSTESVGAAKSITAGAAITATAGAAVAISAGLSASVIAGKNASVSAGKNLNLQAASNVSQTAGKKMRIGSGDSMTIKCDTTAQMNVAEELVIAVGSAKITMKENGDITISGANINIKGTGAVVTKGSSIDNN